mgnify:CR=1 FL=1|jgi:hypothetical protein
MNTYLIDTNADTDRLLLDGDRELLASNGYKITED